MVHSVASGPYIYDIIKQGSIWPTIFLLIPLYQAIWEDKILDKKCWGEPFTKPISKETSTKEILFGGEFLLGRIIW